MSRFTSFSFPASSAGIPVRWTLALMLSLLGSITPLLAQNPQQPPTHLTAYPNSGDVLLTWSGAAGATGYVVQRGTTPVHETFLAQIGGPASGTVVYDDKAVANDTTYYYTVIANGQSQSVPSNEVSAVPLASPSSPYAGAGNGTVSLYWQGVQGAQTYTVYRSASPAGDGGAAIATGLTGTNYTDTIVSNFTAYYYQVSAVFDKGESQKSSPGGATPTGPPTDAPGGLQITGDLRGYLLTWNQVQGATNYKVYAGLSSGNETYSGATSELWTSARFLTPKTTYYLQVSAVNNVGEGPLSSEVQIGIPDYPPIACAVPMTEGPQYERQGMPDYFSGTNCRATGTAMIEPTAPNGTYLGRAQLEIGGNVVQDVAANANSTYIQLSVIFDSTHFPSGSLPITVNAWYKGDEQNAAPDDTFTANGTVINNAYVLANTQYTNSGGAVWGNVANDASLSNYATGASISADRPTLLSHLPGTQAFYIYSHGNTGVFDDCLGPPVDPYSLHGVFSQYVSAEVAAKNRFTQPPFNFVHIDGCQTSGTVNGTQVTENDGLANSFGINGGSVDQAFVGWETEVEDSPKTVQWTTTLWDNLEAGNTVRKALDTANALPNPPQYNPDPNNPLIGANAIPVSVGDQNTTLHGCVYGGVAPAWYR